MSLFAKVDLNILDHDKFDDAEEEVPGSVSLWLWMTVWSRKHETDGIVPIKQVKRHGFGTKGQPMLERLDCLVRHRLIGISGDDVTLLRYAKHNETREDIALRRAETAKRVRNFREKQKGNADGNGVTHPDVTPPVTSGVTGSDFDSGFVSGSSPSERGVPTDQPSGVAPRAPIIAPPRPNKGIQPEVCDSFAKGVHVVTNQDFDFCGFGNQEKLLNAITKDAASSDEDVVIGAARSLGEAWARVERGKLSVLNFCTWLGSRNAPNSVYGKNQPAKGGVRQKIGAPPTETDAEKRQRLATTAPSNDELDFLTPEAG